MVPPMSAYDHATKVVFAGASPEQFDDPTTLAPLGERVWAVQTSGGRLYYSVYWEDSVRRNSARANEIWSIGLFPWGEFMAGTHQLEITLPPLPGTTPAYSNPVSDISFKPNCCMLLAERTMQDDTTGDAHESRLLEYCPDASGIHLPSNNTFSVGDLPAAPLPVPTSSACGKLDE